MPSPVIVALDFDSTSAARELVQCHGPEADHYKIGLQLLTEDGPALARELARQRGRGALSGLMCNDPSAC